MLTRTQRRWSLAGQLLVLQLIIVALVLVAVVAVSWAQSQARFRDTQGRRALSIAENLAENQFSRRAVGGVDVSVARQLTEDARSVSGMSYVLLAGADRRVIASPDPRQLGEQLDLHGSPVLSAGRSWTGVGVDRGRKAVIAHVPVLSEEPGDVGRVIGVIAVGREYPGLVDTVLSSAPDLLIYLGVASLLGVAGSLLVARRVKRQTRGLEPREIARLVEQREALLHGIKEGVVALDPHGRLTLVNDEAARLLGVPADSVGRTVADLDLPPRLRDVLTGADDTGADAIVLRHGRVLVLNRMPVSSRGRDLGSVVTLRDRTELDQLTSELDAARGTTDALRAQAHEFSNRMHIIAGLIELAEYDEALRFATSTTAAHEALARSIAAKISEPAAAALLLAKSAAASERGAELIITDDTELDPAAVGDPRDLLLVVGNLLDNALDALEGRPGRVQVTLRCTADGVLVQVRDSGPGVEPELANEVFRHGFTTKIARSAGARGLGLALTRQACVRRGGWVRVRNDDGAVFTALLPPARVTAT
jgi:two-component system, CitB family, sensor kinase